MRYVKSILILFVSLFALLGCATNQIPDIRVYKEIPFVDKPEGVFVHTIKPIEGTIAADDWAKLRPFLLCVDDEGWAAIKLNWLKACRMMGKKCNIEVDSIDKLIQALDKIARSILEPVP